MNRIFTCLSIFICCCVGAQNPGEIDSTFGTFGFANCGQVIDDAIRTGAIVVQPDSSIVSVQCTGGEDTFYMALTRLLPTGANDNSFGSGGIAIYLALIGVDPQCIALQPDGKILAGGAYSYLGGNYGVIVRFNSNGTPDSTFGVNGYYQSHFPDATSDAVAGLNVLSNGEIIAGGNTVINHGYYSSIIELLPTGVLDSTFGVNGRVTGARFNMYSIAVQNNGKILLGGATTHMAISRYLSSGAIDSSFGTNGIVNTNYDTSEYSWALGTFILPDGNIIGAGQMFTSNGLVSQFLAMEVDSNGVIDNQYGDNGAAVDSAPGSYINQPAAAALQSNGQLIIAGALDPDTSTGDRFAMMRFNADGTVDNSFGNNGIAVALPGGYAYSNGVAIQSDNKILLGGGWEAPDSSIYITVARFGGGTTSAIKQLNETEQQLHLFPNPAASQINLQTTLSGKFDLSIYNMLGQVVSVQKLTLAPGQNLTIDVNAFAGGVYQIALIGLSGNQYGRFVKE